MGNYKINLDLGAENTRLYEFHFKVTERDPDYGDEYNRDYTAIYGEVGGRKFIAVPGSLENFIIDSFMRTDVRKEIVRTLKKEYEEGRCRTLDTRLHAFVMEVLNEYQTVIQRETVIYGNYGNKNFILFPGFSNEQGHFIEIGGPGDIEYNSKKLEEYNKKTFGYYMYGNSPGHRRRWDTVSIAEAVCEHWKIHTKEREAEQMPDKLEIYKNYGVLTREKIPTYTYGGPESTALCSDKITVSVPQGWTVGENTMGETLLTDPFGQNHLVNDVLFGDKNPHFVTCDKNGRKHWYRLEEEKEAGGNEKPHMAAPVHEREER